MIYSNVQFNYYLMQVVVKRSLPIFLFLFPLIIGAQINAGDPLSSARNLIAENELSLFYIENAGSNQKTVGVTFDVANNQLAQIDLTEASTGDLVASSDGNTDIARGAFFGEQYGEALVYAYRSGEGNQGKATFWVDVQFAVDGASTPVAVLPNAFTAGNLFVEDVFDIRPQTQVAAGDFTGDAKDELFVVYTAADQTLKVNYYQMGIAVTSGNGREISANLLDTYSSSSFSFTRSNSLVQMVDITALDIDLDGKDELVMAYWKEDVMRVDVLEINEQGQIEVLLGEDVFDSNINYCFPGSSSDFSFDYLTIKVIGGNFVSEFPGDEFVVGMVFNESCCSNNNNEGTYLLPIRLEEGALVYPNWCGNDSNDEFYTNNGGFAVDDPNGISLAAGDLDGDLDDELVVGLNQIRVFNFAKGEVNSRNTFAMDLVSSFDPDGRGFWGTKGAFLDNYVTVGNVDPLDTDFGNDFRAEIILVTQEEMDDDFGSLERQEFNIEVWGFPESGDLAGVDYRNPGLKTSLDDVLPVDGQIDIRRFSVSVADVNGGGYQLGTPTRTSLNAIVNPLLLLNAPPTHFDVFGSTAYDVSNLYGDNAPPPNINHFNSEYEEIQNNEASFQTEFTSDWAISTTVNAGFSFGAFNIGASFSNKYGEKFSSVNGSSKSITIKERRTALLDDELLAYTVDYDVYEYPVYRPGESGVATNVVVVIPGEIQKTFIGARSPAINYIVDHQHGNLFSYLSKLDEIEPLAGDVYSFSGQEISKNSGFESDFAINWQDATNSGVSNETSSETTIGASAGGAFKGFGLSVSVEGSYSKSELSTRTSKYQEEVNIRGFFGQGEGQSIPGNYPYTVIPVTYWDANGTLVLDYVVQLSNIEFWGAFYDTYDPAFLLLDPFKPEKGFENPDTYNEADRFRTREILFSERPEAGKDITIKARIHNYGFQPTPVDTNIELCFYYLDPDGSDQLESIGCQSIQTAMQGRLDALDREIIEMPWAIPAGVGPDTKVVVLIDPNNTLPEEVHDYPNENGVSNNIGWTCLLSPNCSSPTSKGQIGPALTTSVNQQVLLKTGLKVAPNPVRDWTWLMLDGQWEGQLQIQVINSLGQTLKSFPIQASNGEDRIPLNFDNLENGVYHLIVSNDKLMGQLSFIVSN